jgi:TetR/AcrR family tetracycline transcriptional repressor
MKLDSETILEAALALLDEVGMDKLSTRLLAERLGVQQPALYWHFKNKRALLDAMSGQILRRAHERRLPLEGESWEDVPARERAQLPACAAGAARRCAPACGHRARSGRPGNGGGPARSRGQPRHAGDGGDGADDRAGPLHRGLRARGTGRARRRASARQQTLDAAAASRPLLAEAFASYRKAGPDAMFDIGVQLMIEGAKARLANKKTKEGKEPKAAPRKPTPRR